MGVVFFMGEAGGSAAEYWRIISSGIFRLYQQVKNNEYSAAEYIKKISS